MFNSQLVLVDFFCKGKFSILTMMSDFRTNFSVYFLFPNSPEAIRHSLKNGYITSDTGGS